MPEQEVQPIIEEIQRLAEERRRALAAGGAPEEAPHVVRPVDLRARTQIPAHHPLRWLLALADRVRRRVLQAILIRQSEFNRRSSAAMALLSAQLDESERERERLQDAINHLATRIAELDRRLTSARDGALSAGGAAGPARPPAVSADPIFARIAARLRGDESTIRERQRPYLEVFAGADGPILDVACGRGEFLELLRDAGRPARGLDLTPENVRRCREKGLDVAETDALTYLAGLADQSLSGIVAFQFIEHLAGDDLVTFLRLCATKLRPAAKLVLETINPDALAALPIFFADLTHAQPIPPQTAALLLEACGFRSVEIRYTSEFPAAARLTPSGDGSPVGQRFDAAVDSLNRLVWGAREYAVIGTR